MVISISRDNWACNPLFCRILRFGLLEERGRAVSAGAFVTRRRPLHGSGRRSLSFEMDAVKFTSRGECCFRDTHRLARLVHCTTVGGSCVRNHAR